MIFTLIYGGITHHYLSPNLPYCNRINNYGTIHNEYVIAMAGSKNVKLGLLKGKDSACGEIFGPISSFKMTNNIDFMLGGYNTNFDSFEKINIKPPSVGGITPVAGFNFKLPLYEVNKVKLSLDTLVSLEIITHGLSLSF